MSLNPLVATLLVDMNFMVIRADGNFLKRKKTHTQQLNRMKVLTHILYFRYKY